MRISLVFPHKIHGTVSTATPPTSCLLTSRLRSRALPVPFVAFGCSRVEGTLLFLLLNRSNLSTHSFLSCVDLQFISASRRSEQPGLVEYQHISFRYISRIDCPRPFSPRYISTISLHYPSCTYGIHFRCRTSWSIYFGVRGWAADDLRLFLRRCVCHELFLYLFR